MLDYNVPGGKKIVEDGGGREKVAIGVGHVVFIVRQIIS